MAALRASSISCREFSMWRSRWVMICETRTASALSSLARASSAALSTCAPRL